LLIADPGEERVGFRWFDGRSYDSVSSPPSLLPAVLKKSHPPRDHGQVDRWSRLRLARLEARDDVLSATFDDGPIGLDRERLEDGIRMMLRMHAALASALAELPVEEATFSSTEIGTYRSAPVRIVRRADVGDYAGRVRALERAGRWRRIDWYIKRAVPYVIGALVLMLCILVRYPRLIR
jgi:hypothetical protein